MVERLKALPKPTSEGDQKFANNISKIQTTISTLEQENSLARLEYTVVEAIARSAFPDDILKKFNEVVIVDREAFIDRVVADEDRTPVEGSTLYEQSTNQTARLDPYRLSLASS